MNITSYLRQRDEIIRGTELYPYYIEHEQLNGQFTLASAGLSNFLPQLPVSTHPALFRDLLVHKRLSLFEQDKYVALEMLTTENYDQHLAALLKQQASVICTFHLGSYRLLNLFLLRNKIPFTLVTAKAFISEEETKLAERFNQLDPSASSAFRIIDGEHPSAGLGMLRELKSGRNLVVYIDGNSGSGATASLNANCCLVDFLAQQLFARKGIAYIAQRANVPLVPVVCYRPTIDDIRLRFLDPILPQPGADAQAEAVKTTQLIYNAASPFIAEYPGQWEAWTYIHKTAHIINPYQPVKELLSVVSKPRFNLARFGLIRMGKKHFLFGKNTYSSHPIDEYLFNQLKSLLLAQDVRFDMEKCLFDELEKEGVLI